VIAEQCTVVARVSTNFFRFGSLEIFNEAKGNFAGGPSAGNHALKEKLLDHLLKYFPDKIYGDSVGTCKYKKWLKEVTVRTATLGIY